MHTCHMDSKSPFSRLRAAVTGLPFCATIMLALAANFMWADGHDQQRCIELAVLGVALIFALASGAIPRALQAVPGLPRILCLAFLALGAAASIDVVSPRHAWAEWSMFVLLGLTALLVAADVAASGMSGLQRLLQMLGVVCALYSLRVLLVYGASMTAQVQVDFHALAPGFSNARFLNHAQTALLPLLVLLSRQLRGRWPARAMFMVTAFWWSLIYVGEARATVLALIVGGVVALMLRRRAARGWLLAMAASAAAGLVLYLVLFIAVPWLLGMAPIGAPSNLIARSAADPASGRQFLWKLALELMSQHPLLGVGPQHFAHYGHVVYIGAHPHDWLFQIGAEWGLPALLCVIAILALGMRALVRAAATIPQTDRPRQDVATALIAATAAIVVDGLFSGVLVMPQSQMAIALVMGLAMGWVRSLRTIAVPSVTPLVRYAGLGVSLLALVLIIAITGPDVGRKWQGAPLDAGEQAHNERALWPRLWVAGYF